MNKKKTKHLDLGCGPRPRNPFNADELYGIDIIDQNDCNFHYKQCNVVLEPLPFSDSSFDSLSAYDFLEHIPRFAVINNKTVFPFIELMNEVYRCLKPGGIFYAITPCYPRNECFVDPTHINFITKDTHKYFTAPRHDAKMYGFNGQFEIKEVRRVRVTLEINKPNISNIKYLLKDAYYTLHFSKKGHILWEFEAVK